MVEPFGRGFESLQVHFCMCKRRGVPSIKGGASMLFCPFTMASKIVGQ